MNVKHFMKQSASKALSDGGKCCHVTPWYVENRLVCHVTVAILVFLAPEMTHLTDKPKTLSVRGPAAHTANI